MNLNTFPQHQKLEQPAIPLVMQTRGKFDEVFGEARLLAKNQQQSNKGEVHSIPDFLTARGIESAAIIAKVRTLLTNEYAWRFQEKQRNKPYQYRFEIKLNGNVFYLTTLLHSDGRFEIGRKTFGEKIDTYVKKPHKHKLKNQN